MQLGAAGAGAWTFSCLAPSSSLGAAANSRLNIALLGCGNRMRQLLPSILDAGENVVAVCDVSTSQVARMKNEFAGKHGAAGTALANAKVYDD